MSTGRSYAGVPPEDRAARRRRQLLDAGLALFGTTGYRKTTVRQLCREARVAAHRQPYCEVERHHIGVEVQRSWRS